MDARTYLVFGGLLATISSSANGSLLEQTGYRINILEDDVGPTVDALMNLCNKSPPGSLFAVYSLTKMNFNTFVLVTDDLTNPDLWKDIATDREHVISVKERDKLLKLLERDTRFGKCPLDKFFTDHIGYCQDCSDELDSLPEECY
ncbi:hypothetical protein DPMN_175421, partial [Dreissena polymorpha]